MATRNPLEDFLNSDVDESAITDLVGTLESQLASPTGKEPQAQISAASGAVNHVHGGQVGSTVTHGVPAAPSTIQVKPAPTGQVQITNSNGGKGSHLIGLNSVVTATNALPVNSNVNSVGHSNASANVIHQNPSVTVTNSNTVSSAAPGFLPKQVIVSIGSTNTGTLVVGATQNNVVYSNSVTNNVMTVAKPGNSNSSVSGNSAIYDLASIAAEQQRLTVPGSTTQLAAPIVHSKPATLATAPVKVQIKEEKPPQPVVVNVVQPPKTQPAQYVVKQEPPACAPTPVNIANIPRSVKQEVKFITQPQVSQIQTVSMTRPVAPASVQGSVSSATSNVITITKGQPPQAVTVLRPTVSHPSQQIQVVSASHPRTGLPVNVSHKLAPRINATQPVRIAPQATTIRQPGNVGPTIQLPPGLQLPPGAMVVKNEQGQLMVIQQPQGGVHSAAATPGTVRIVRPSVPGLQQTIQVSQPGQGPMAVRPVSTMTVTRPLAAPQTVHSAPRPAPRAPAPARPLTAVPRPQTAPRPGVVTAPQAPGRMGFHSRQGVHPSRMSGARVQNLQIGPHGVPHQGAAHMGPPISNHPHMVSRTTGSPHLGPSVSGSPHMGLQNSGSPHMGHHGGMSPHMRPPPSGSPLNRPSLPGSPHTPIPGSPIGVPGSPLGSPHTRSPMSTPPLGDPHIHHSRGPSPGALRSTSPAGHTNMGASNGPIFQLGGPRDQSPSHPLPGPAASPGGTSTNTQPKYMLENVRKCKNFLSTLLKLAASQPQNTVSNVRELIQGLIDGRVEPEAFTARLQVELKSSPQPYLVPFLKKSLPLLRQSMLMSKMHIDGVRPPPPEVLRQPGMVRPATSQAPRTHTVVRPGQAVPKVSPSAIRPNLTTQQLQQMMIAQRLGPQAAKAASTNQTKALLVKGQTSSTPTAVNALAKHVASSQPKEKRKYDSSLKEDDDINDVATMGGVNLTEESRNILATNSELMAGQLRSCKDENFLASRPLAARINAIAKKHGLDEAPQGVMNLISHATQERLRNIVERLATTADHRIEMYKTDSKYETTSEVRLQLRFLEDLDKLEKKRHEEAEREVLLRAAKSRSKHEDPEQLKLKEKAKAMQQAEMEEVRQREANLTALAAIGPRKKKLKMDGPDPGSSTSAQSSSASRPGAPLRPRIKQVKLRDLMFLLEQERETCQSNLLYQAYLKN